MAITWGGVGGNVEEIEVVSTSDMAESVVAAAAPAEIIKTCWRYFVVHIPGLGVSWRNLHDVFKQPAPNY